MEVIYIYNKNLEIVSQPWCKDLQTFNNNPFRYFKYWNDDCYASTVKFNRPIWDNGTVREMTREEICESGDLSVLNDGEVWEDNEIKVIPRPDGLKIEWIYPNWLETATDSEIYIDTLKKEYIEYKEIDTPSILREMELTDTSIVDEYILMMIKLRELISKYNMGISTISDIPTPSKALVDFKNRIKNIL